MGELPAGWAWARLGDLGAWTGGGTPSKANAAFWTEGEIPWVSPKDMKAERVGEAAERITLAAVQSSAAKMVPAGSILCVVRSGILKHTFPVAIAECDLTLNQDMRALTPAAGVNADYARLFLTLNNDAILHGCAKDGTTVASINPDKLAAVSIPLAPVAEQARIAKEAKRLLAEVDEAEAVLTRARASLADYRVSLLHAACIGQLTAAWRASRPQPAEDGPALLRRILAERRAVWERAELARLHARGKPPAGDAWKARYREPAGPDVDGLLTLPGGWMWASLEQLCFIVGGITVDAKRTGSSLAAVPYLRVANVQRGKLDLSQVKMLQAPFDRIEALRLVPNDVLLNEGGDRDKVGRGWVWTGELPLCIHQNHIFRARPCLPDMDGRFISHYLNETGRAYFLDAAIQTTNLAPISMAKITRVPVPVPPSDELHKIVKLIADGLEEAEAGDARTTDIATLRQSILHAAFTGRLVPQDPADEPAAVLLARLRDASIVPRRTRKQARAA